MGRLADRAGPVRLIGAFRRSVIRLPVFPRHAPRRPQSSTARLALSRPPGCSRRAGDFRWLFACLQERLGGGDVDRCAGVTYRKKPSPASRTGICYEGEQRANVLLLACCIQEGDQGPSDPGRL
jgi:hypothetical protein